MEIHRRKCFRRQSGQSVDSGGIAGEAVDLHPSFEQAERVGGFRALALANFHHFHRPGFVNDNRSIPLNRTDGAAHTICGHYVNDLAPALPMLQKDLSGLDFNVIGMGAGEHNFHSTIFSLILKNQNFGQARVPGPRTATAGRFPVAAPWARTGIPLTKTQSIPAAICGSFP